MAKKKLVTRQFTVTLVEYVGPDAEPSSANDVEEVISEALCDHNGSTVMVHAAGKAKVIVEGVA